MKHIWKLLLALIAGVLVLIGLTGPSAKNASTPAPAAAGSAAAPVAAAAPVPATVPAQAATPIQPPVVAAVPAPVAVPAAAPAPIQTRKTLNQKTQTVLLLENAIKDGGVRAETSITGQGIGIAAEAYRTSVGKLSVIAVDQKMGLFQAQNDRKPKNYQEFMDKIIEPGKPDGIQLPMLPYYQEYAYDPEAHELIVVEFPAKREQRQKETTGAAGL